MDKSNSSKDVSEEVTRESLIALSYTAPEEETTARHLNGKLIGEALAGAVKVDGNDKYRSRLISISYLQSPDTKALPVLPGENYAGCLLRLGAQNEFKWSTLLDLLESKKIGTDAYDEQ